MGTNKMRKRILWVGALSVAIAASGIYGYSAVQAAGSNGSTSTGTTTATQVDKQRISIEKAEQLALDVAKGTVKEIKLVHYKGRLAYMVIIKQSDQGAKVWIDASTGKSLGKITFGNHHYDDGGDYNHNHDHRDHYPSGLIGTGKAVEAALKHAGGGNVIEVDLDEDDNRWIYEVEVKTAKGSVEVEVDALSGKIVKAEYDHDDDDRYDD